MNATNSREALEAISIISQKVLSMESQPSAAELQEYLDAIAEMAKGNRDHVIAVLSMAEAEKKEEKKAAEEKAAAEKAAEEKSAAEKAEAEKTEQGFIDVRIPYSRKDRFKVLCKSARWDSIRRTWMVRADDEAKARELEEKWANVAR